MRAFPRRISLLGLVFASALPLMAQTGNPFSATWELNIAKSTFSPGPAPKSETVTITDDKVTVEGVDPAGAPFKWSYAPKPGQAVPIEGVGNSTVKGDIKGNTVDHTWTGDIGNTHGHGVVAKDGKTMTYKQNGKSAEGKPTHNVYLFEKK